MMIEIRKGNRITEINTRLRGIRVFINFCSEREYAEGFSYPLLKEDETVKEPYVCIPDSVKEIAADAFDGCNNLTILCPEGSAAHDYAILKEIPYLIR